MRNQLLRGGFSSKFFDLLALNITRILSAFFVQLRSTSQDSNWKSALRGPSVIAKPLIILGVVIVTLIMRIKQVQRWFWVQTQ